jgi:hypothetical protein
MYGDSHNAGMLYGHNIIEYSGQGRFMSHTEIPLSSDNFQEPKRFDGAESAALAECQSSRTGGTFRYSYYKPPVCKFTCTNHKQSVACMEFKFVKYPSGQNGTVLPGC